jgi:hypothetical protein
LPLHLLALPILSSPGGLVELWVAPAGLLRATSIVNGANEAPIVSYKCHPYPLGLEQVKTRRNLSMNKIFEQVGDIQKGHTLFYGVTFLIYLF